MKKKILILAGGISKERSISLDTGFQVAKELKKNGYNVKISEPDVSLSKNINTENIDFFFADLSDQKSIVDIADEIIKYGKIDGSREQTNYDNAYYTPFNDPLLPIFSGNSSIQDPNRWQPLSLSSFIDQSGNLIDGGATQFLNPEWGNVSPFALKNDESIFKLL